jgi:hypothetical protein
MKSDKIKVFDCKILLHAVKFHYILLSFAIYHKILCRTGKEQKILLNFAKLLAKMSLNISWSVEKGTILSVNEPLTSFH